MEKGRKYTRKIASILGAVFGGFGKKKAFEPEVIAPSAQMPKLRLPFIDPLEREYRNPLKGHRTPTQRRKRRLRKIVNASKRRNRT